MKRQIGAEYKEGTCGFCVWAPEAEKVELLLKDQSPVPLQKDALGYWSTSLEVEPGTLYKFVVEGKALPDPASRSQPEGVHSWSAVVNTNFRWKDDSWRGKSSNEMIIYELHVSTFSEDGSFEGVLQKLDHLLELGVNTLELMPLAQFPGNRNWGYDGVYPFAVQNSYGSRDSLKRLIDACHSNGLAVLLDVVYNHQGPEGNYLSAFGPYFTEKYRTPWGSAINYDDKYSDEVRNFFLQNALMWLEEFHFDGLRLDAVHEIIDRGAQHFLKELSQRVDELEKRTGRQYVLIAESDLNDARLVSPYSRGGYGLEAQWVDDFHHSLHTVLTGEDKGYYSDYGKLEFVAKSLQQAFVYDGTYSSFRKKSIGNSPRDCSPGNFVVSLQNHDQVGNRLLGERLSQLVSFEALKLATGILLLSPYVPMLFMGEEFAEDMPFLYFVSHSDKKLVEAVREGREKEFSYFFGKGDEGFSDPQSEETFRKSKLNWNFKSEPIKAYIFSYYKKLIRLRKEGSFEAFRNSSLKAEVINNYLLIISGKSGSVQLLALCNFNKEAETTDLPQGKEWKPIFSSADKKWGGTVEHKALNIAGKAEVAGESLLILEA